MFFVSGKHCFYGYLTGTLQIVRKTAENVKSRSTYKISHDVHCC